VRQRDLDGVCGFCAAAVLGLVVGSRLSTSLSLLTAGLLLREVAGSSHGRGRGVPMSIGATAH